MTHKEHKLQVAICNYLKMQYGHVLFISDTVANVKLTPTQQSRNKAIQKSDFSCPDLIILHPNGRYHGLFLELKQESPYKQDGTLKKQKVVVKNKAGQVTSIYDHLEEQDRALRNLTSLGYKAEFCWSLDMAVKIISQYMKGV